MARAGWLAGGVRGGEGAAIAGVVRHLATGHMTAG